MHTWGWGSDKWMIGVNEVSDFAFVLVELKAKSSVSGHEDYKSAEGGAVEASLRAVGFESQQ